MARDGKRTARVGDSIRAELMDLILRGAIRDPRAKDVLVSDVRITDDLRHARIYLRTLEEADAKRKARAVEAMTSAGGYLRRELGHRLGLRFVPELQFFWDDVVDSGLRMEQLFHEIRTSPDEGGSKDDDG